IFLQKAESPDLGKQCGVKSCNQLAFLPITCNECRCSFCELHFAFEAHSCQRSLSQDARVPSCQLYSKPVPTPKRQRPDAVMNDHLSKYCEVYRKKRIFVSVLLARMQEKR
ncbi:hypothetical protein PENTCL1PPCAC_8003, partial [Pristionchus entomophagus]